MAERVYAILTIKRYNGRYAEKEDEFSGPPDKCIEYLLLKYSSLPEIAKLPTLAALGLRNIELEPKKHG